METLLIYQDDVSNKFWKINQTGNSYIVTYGKVGTVGAIKTKTFESEDECRKETDKLIRSKMKKGYVPAESPSHILKDTTMTETMFWQLIDKCKEKGKDSDEQMEWLMAQLSKRPVKDIIMFDFILNKYYSKSYTSDLWAAAYIIMGGCSDDCFDYFRAFLLYLGKEPYEAAIKNPETLMPYLKLIEEQDEMPQLEELLSVACEAYEEKTGQDDEEYHDLYEKLTNDSYIQPEIKFDWDEDDEEGLKKKFPLLWEAFGETPLEY
jgi:predicted DNA-binding WGR domain protein